LNSSNPATENLTGSSFGESSCDFLRIEGIPDFWIRVRQAPHRLLALDYDGTLAPFRVERDLAKPLEGVWEALDTIRQLPTTSLAILSGRPAHQVRTLLGGDLPIPIYGAHGYELLHPNGHIKRFGLSNQQVEGLAKARTAAVDAGYESALEQKATGIALHTRGKSRPEEMEELILVVWKPLADQHDLNIMQFDGGVELCALARHKGLALADLLRQMTPGTLPVYIGDDTTDEDAFQYVRSIGLGIKVGHPREHTTALGRVPDETAVLAILRDWPIATRA
jgi:trehalose-phosphatase